MGAGAGFFRHGQFIVPIVALLIILGIVFAFGGHFGDYE